MHQIIYDMILSIRKGCCIYINMSEINTSHIQMVAVESNICDYRYRPVGMSIQKVIQL